MIDMTRQPERGQISLEKECKWNVHKTYKRRSVHLMYVQFPSCVQEKVSLAFPYCILIVFLVNFDCLFLSWGSKTPIFGWRHTQAISCLDEFLRFIYFWDLFLSNWSWPNSFFWCVHFLYFLTVRIDYFSQIPIKTRFELGVPISTLMFWSYTYYFSCVGITLNADIFTNSSPEYQSRIYLVKTSDIQLSCLTFKEKDAIWSLSVCYVLRRRVAMSFATLYQNMASPEYMTILGGSIYQFHILGLFIYVFMPISNIHQQILPTQMIYTKF